jgi:hypothetical protein
MLTASTMEVDDPSLALEEILRQLDLKRNLLKNSVGILFCNCEFVEEGIVGKLCGALPFDTAGCTTLASAEREKCEFEQLSLSVLTSDDVSFSTAISAPITKSGVSSSVAEVYRRALGKLGGGEDAQKPALVLAYAPVIIDVGSYSISYSLLKACGNIPVFGGFSCDNTLRYEQNKVLWNGGSFSDRLALILMSGEVKPRFHVTALPESAARRKWGVITESEGHVIRKVNGVPLIDYLMSLGLSSDDFQSGKLALPFAIDAGDGTPPTVRSLRIVMPQGYGICANDVPTGAAFTVVQLDCGGVVETARNTVDKLLQEEDANGIFIHSCINRNTLLGLRECDEMKVMAALGNKAPYHLSYAGGEICPLKNETGAYVNRFHNFTLVSCVL